jgi:hypothetical protein
VEIEQDPRDGAAVLDREAAAVEIEQASGPRRPGLERRLGRTDVTVRIGRRANRAGGVPVEGIDRERRGTAGWGRDGRQAIGLVEGIGGVGVDVVGRLEEVAELVELGDLVDAGDRLLDQLVGPVVCVGRGRPALGLGQPVAVEVVGVVSGRRREARARQARQIVVDEALAVVAGVTGRDVGQRAPVGGDVAGPVEGLAERTFAAEADAGRALG